MQFNGELCDRFGVPFLGFTPERPPKKRTTAASPPHPTDGTLRQRNGKTGVTRVYDGTVANDLRVIATEDGTFVARVTGENIKHVRGAIEGLRDKMARAGSSAKVRFAVANGHVDRRLDRPAPVPVGVHAPRRAVRRSRASHTPLASLLK